MITEPNLYATELSLDRRTVILRVHGRVDRDDNREWESFVVTEDDYIGYLAPGELASVIPVALAARLRRSHFLFLGYALRDWHLRLLLNRLWGDEKVGYRSWSVQPDASALETEFWRRRDVDLFELELDDYVKALEQRLTEVRGMSATATFRPYKGLAPFDDEPFDALLFFGREREREIIVANLLASRLTVLYGPTGVGKSSLLRAGVAQRLRTFADSSVAIISSWGEDPTEEIDEAIAASEGDTHLILDQIEEYFLYHDPDSAFAQRLPELVTEPGLRVNVLLGIREDSLAKLDLFKSRIPNLFANYLRLDHLDRVAARAAVVGPLERLNELAPEEEPYRAEPELVEAVLDQVATGRIEYGLSGRGVVPGQDESGRVEAPFLQLVLERLWDVEQEGGSRTIRLETLERLGGAETIVRRHLERALEALAAGAARARRGHVRAPRDAVRDEDRARRGRSRSLRAGR